MHYLISKCFLSLLSGRVPVYSAKGLDSIWTGILLPLGAGKAAPLPSGEDGSMAAKPPSMGMKFQKNYKVYDAEYDKACQASQSCEQVVTSPYQHK